MLERAVLSAAMVLALVVCGRWTEQWQSGIYHDMGDPALGACLGACTLAAVVLLFPLILATYKLDKHYWNMKGWPLSTAINCMYTVWDVLGAIMNLVRVYSYSNFFLEHLLAIYGFVRVILLPPPLPHPHRSIPRTSLDSRCLHQSSHMHFLPPSPPPCRALGFGS